jgi:hypothetical protein
VKAINSALLRTLPYHASGYGKTRTRRLADARMHTLTLAEPWHEHPSARHWLRDAMDAMDAMDVRLERASLASQACQRVYSI